MPLLFWGAHRGLEQGISRGGRGTLGGGGLKEQKSLVHREDTTLLSIGGKSVSDIDHRQFGHGKSKKRFHPSENGALTEGTP